LLQHMFYLLRTCKLGHVEHGVNEKTNNSCSKYTQSSVECCPYYWQSSTDQSYINDDLLYSM